MKYKVGDKVKVVQFKERAIDAPKYTIGNIGTVDAIELDQGEHIYRVTFENDLEGWNYKENQLEIVKGEEDACI